MMVPDDLGMGLKTGCLFKGGKKLMQPQVGYLQHVSD